MIIIKTGTFKGADSIKIINGHKERFFSLGVFQNLKEVILALFSPDKYMLPLALSILLTIG